ncbi:MAG: ABC transporter substrate-binding protein [Burkholderiaceae bacterium]|jgi:peptide/nickel transport system substrate-binding protein
MRLQRLVWMLFWVALFAASDVSAKTLRWAARGDAANLDPGAFNEIVTENVIALIYDSLVDRDRNLAIVPSLAVSWTQVNDTTWRLKLRQGVTFHDGTPFTASDAAFSIQRAQEETSQIAQYARPLGKPVAVDDYTLELRQDKPDPILLEHLATVSMMSRAWCVANKVEHPLNFAQKQETFAANHALGTGPYILVSREPGVRTVLKRNPNWWHPFEGNVTDIIFTPIGSDPTRTAALLSGDVDLITEPPPQDIERLGANSSLRVTTTTESRILFFGMDQNSDELAYGSVKGRNPFKDIRVREAFFRVIDAQAIASKIMRGQAKTTDCMTTAAIGCLDPELEVHPPVDIERAKKLMAEAGYPDGFSLTLDCPNDRYVNDQQICVALVGMLARINVKLSVNAMPKTIYFPKIQRYDTSFYLLGWGGAIVDAQIVLDPLIHSFDAKTQRGAQNMGRYVDPDLDRLIDAADVEPNVEKRRQILIQTLHLQAQRFHELPLDRPAMSWVSRSNVKPVILSSGFVRADWIQVDDGKP